MCPDVIFQILLLGSRPMASHYVNCYVTAVSYASSSSKRKEKEKENKISIKIENKRKKKIKIIHIQSVP